MELMAKTTSQALIQLTLYRAWLIRKQSDVFLLLLHTATTLEGTRRGDEPAGFVYTYNFFLMCFQVRINCCPFKLKRRSNWVRWGETFGTCINPKRMLNAARGVNKPAEWGEYLWKYTTRQLDYIMGGERGTVQLKLCVRVAVAAARTPAPTPGFLIASLLWAALPSPQLPRLPSREASLVFSTTTTCCPVPTTQRLLPFSTEKWPDCKPTARCLWRGLSNHPTFEGLIF